MLSNIILVTRNLGDGGVYVKKRKRYMVNWPRVIIVNLALLLLIVFVFGKIWGKKSNNVTKEVLSTKITAKKGNITFEENKFFRKFVIATEKEQGDSNGDIKFEDKSSYLAISLDKEKNKEPYFAYSKKSQADFIKCDKSNDKYLVKVKTIYKENNYVYVDPKDKKNIVILISKSKKPYEHVVNIDPGHGGMDKGANYKDLFEKDLTLKISKLTQNYLLYSGYKVNLSRNDDKLNALKNVADWSNTNGGEILVSIHINSNKESQYKGISTYYSETRSEIVSSSQNAERLKLAKALQQEIASSTWQDRGVFKQNLKVLRYSKLPCVLLECGFLSNNEDRAKLQNDQTLTGLSFDISKGIEDYFKNNINYTTKGSNGGTIANETGGN